MDSTRLQHGEGRRKVEPRSSFVELVQRDSKLRKTSRWHACQIGRGDFASAGLLSPQAAAREHGRHLTSATLQQLLREPASNTVHVLKEDQSWTTTVRFPLGVFCQMESEHRRETLRLAALLQSESATQLRVYTENRVECSGTNSILNLIASTPLQRSFGAAAPPPRVDDRARSKRAASCSQITREIPVAIGYILAIVVHHGELLAIPIYGRVALGWVARNENCSCALALHFNFSLGRSPVLRLYRGTASPLGPQPALHRVRFLPLSPSPLQIANSMAPRIADSDSADDTPRTGVSAAASPSTAPTSRAGGGRRSKAASTTGGDSIIIDSDDDSDEPVKPSGSVVDVLWCFTQHS